MTQPRVTVRSRYDGDFEHLFNRFRRGVEKADVMSDFYRHQEYEKPSKKRNRKKAAAKKREQRRVVESNANRPMV